MATPTDHWTLTRLTRTGAVVVVALTLLNLTVHTAARMLGGSMALDPLGQDPGHIIPWYDVAWKTALPLAVGIALVAWLRRSRRGLTILLAAALVVFVPSSAVPAWVAHDGITSAALLLLHLLPIIAFSMVALRVRAAQPASSPREARRVAS